MTPGHTIHMMFPVPLVMIAMWGHYVTLHMLQLCCKLGYYSQSLDRDKLECFHNSPETRD